MSVYLLSSFIFCRIIFYNYLKNFFYKKNKNKNLISLYFLIYFKKNKNKNLISSYFSIYFNLKKSTKNKTREGRALPLKKLLKFSDR